MYHPPARHLHTTESILQTAGVSPPKTVTINPNIGEHESLTYRNLTDHVEPAGSSRIIDDGSGDRRKTVTFNPVEDVVAGQVSGKTSVRTKSLLQLEEQRLLPDVKPGVQEEEHKRQASTLILCYETF